MGITHPRPRFPSPALIIACLALFAALGGSTYAATQAASSGKIHFTTAKLKNGWANNGGQYPSGGYAKDSLGVVHLRGEIMGGTDGATAFVLPKALRPKHILHHPVFTCSYVMGLVAILPNGDVVPSGGMDTCQTWLDGISFVAGE